MVRKYNQTTVKKQSVNKKCKNIPTAYKQFYAVPVLTIFDIALKIYLANTNCFCFWLSR